MFPFTRHLNSPSSGVLIGRWRGPFEMRHVESLPWWMGRVRAQQMLFMIINIFIQISYEGIGNCITESLWEKAGFEITGASLTNVFNHWLSLNSPARSPWLFYLVVRTQSKRQLVTCSSVTPSCNLTPKLPPHPRSSWEVPYYDITGSVII